MNSEDISAAAGGLAVSLHEAADRRSDLAFVLDIPLKDWEYAVNLA